MSEREDYSNDVKTTGEAAIHMQVIGGLIGIAGLYLLGECLGGDGPINIGILASGLGTVALGYKLYRRGIRIDGNMVRLSTNKAVEVRRQNED